MDQTSQVNTTGVHFIHKVTVTHSPSEISTLLLEVLLADLEVSTATLPTALTDRSLRPNFLLQVLQGACFPIDRQLLLLVVP